MKDIHKHTTSFLGFDIDKLQLIGQGRQGRVFMLQENKVLKVYYRKNSCKDQLEILQKGQGSRFFPTVFNYDRYAVIMSFVDGITLSDYLKKNSLNKVLSIELVKLVEDFKKLQFTRLDIRLCHIFVQNNETLKIIDPRGSYKIVQAYPRLMLRGLHEHGVLDEFLNNIMHEYPYYYSYWISKIAEIIKAH